MAERRASPIEIATGIWHWSAPHPRIGIEVHSYFLPEERVVIDPVAPAEGLDWFADLSARQGSAERIPAARRSLKASASRPRTPFGPPEHVLLTNRHHYRSSAQFVERFGATVRCSRAGLHEFTHGELVEPFDFGDELPGGIVAHRVGAICPDETALYVPAREALALADGAVRWEPGGSLVFVPDRYLDDPAGTKAGLRESYRRLAEELDFRHLLLAHGEPFVGTGREALAAFAG
ncbi:MAG TPA: hypothetical protein VI503_00675 [Gaiellaceae bacterium]|nr:hypothetical protein [Gaiellaceae bacterium]